MLADIGKKKIEFILYHFVKSLEVFFNYNNNPCDNYHLIFWPFDFSTFQLADILMPWTDKWKKGLIVQKSLAETMAAAVSESLKNKSPVLTIKRAGRQNGQWQDFIDREHSTVDHLLQNSFGAFCQQIQDKNGLTPKSSYHHTIGGYRVRRKNSSSNSNSPESSPPDKWFVLNFQD